jgi:hypothetical protein
VTDLVAVALGVLFLVLWVCAMIYANSLSKAFTLGKEDYVRRKNRSGEYTGLARKAYRRGRHRAALTSNPKLKNKGAVRKLTT